MALSNIDAIGRKYMIRGFTKGLLTGILIGVAFIYMLSMTRVVAVSVIKFPDIHQFLIWAYDNLRLSAIPFFGVIVFFVRDLARLKRVLKDDAASIEKIGQIDHLIDIWIKLFFGIGVIWTAIGMRSALLEGLGDLDATTAASEGAFVILRRLVDGGILLALSTTIFGGIGGYLMHLIKILYLGKQLQFRYHRSVKNESEQVMHLLTSIAESVKHFSTRA